MQFRSQGLLFENAHVITDGCCGNIKVIYYTITYYTQSKSRRKVMIIHSLIHLLPDIKQCPHQLI